MDTRRQMAAMLASGRNGTQLQQGDPTAWLELAWSEGVSGLLAGRLQAGGWSPLPASLAARCSGLAAAELARRWLLRQALTMLAAQGVPVLVLKGSALAYWLYPQPWLRECSDVDLLFADRAAAVRAGELLRPLGYAPVFAPGRFDHELLCRAQGSTLRPDLDLHWGLSRMPALAKLPVFAALLSRARPLPMLGDAALGPGPADALLHACVHRASNLVAGLGDRLKWLYDVHLLAAALDETDWTEFIGRCGEARVCGLAVDALQATVDMFSTGLPAGLLDRLRAHSAGDALDASRLGDWRYVQRRNLAALPGIGARMAWLWQRAVPSAGYLRELYGEDSSRATLLWMRLRRGLVRLTARD